MTNLLAEVRKRIPSCCITTRCRRKRCSVSLKNAPRPHLIIDMDKAAISKNARKCDYIFIEESDNAWVVAMELKRGLAAASEIVEQLQAGALFADQKIPKKFRVRFCPLVASGAIWKAERNKLKKKSNRIEFREEYVVVQRIKCGAPLTSALKNTA